MKYRKELIKKLVDKTVHVKRLWYDPYIGCRWDVVGEKWNLSIEEYDFLIRNGHLSPKTENPESIDEIDLVLTEKALTLIANENKN